MRIDRFWSRALPLAGICLMGSAAHLDAQPFQLSSIPFSTILQATANGGVLTGDHVVEAGEEVDDIVVIGGTLTVRGTVSGDAVVVGGNLVLESSGSISGDAVVTGGEILDHGGKILGEMRIVDGADEALAGRGAEAREGLAAAAAARHDAAQARVEARRAVRVTSHDEHSWFGPIRRGLSGFISTVALGIVLAGIGSALIFYGRPYLETVSDTIRTSTVRSGAVGIAAGFLVLPAYIVLLVALAVSLLGIPLLLVAIPVYPLAVAAAAAMGILAASHAIGERTADQRRESFDLRYRNSYSYLFTGLGMLLTPLLAAHLLHMTGFLSFLGTMLEIVTWIVIWLAATVGFGAVILSRAGTRRTFVASSLDSMYDSDPLFDEPVGRDQNV